MKDKLIQEYTEKLGVPPCNDLDQVILDLQMFGVASPSFGAAHTLNLLIHGAEEYTGTEQTAKIQEAIEAQAKALTTDEATTVTELLYGQVAILNAAFNRYMQMAALTTNSNQFVIYSEAAMKAQEQARKTLQTLHDIKNPKPRTVFIKNAIAQQVNQLVTKTEELQKQLEAQPYAKVDFGSTEITKRSPETIDLPAAPVGTIDGAKKRGRKGKSSAKLD
jgi:phosphoglycolate phosphatase-like HAD superfamily hydrolase